MAFILSFAVGLAVVRGSGAEAPIIVADGAGLTLAVDQAADVEVVYRGGGRVSVRALQQDVASLRTSAASYATAEALARLSQRVDSTNGTATAAMTVAAGAVDPDAIAATVARQVAAALEPLQAQIRALTANATCGSSLMDGLPANARVVPSRCASGEGGSCQIGCRPGFVSTLATNIARDKPLRARGNALIRSGETESVYLPRAITDGTAPTSNDISPGSGNDLGRWLAWCDSGQPGGADSSRPAQRGDRPCVVTIDLEETSTIDEVEYTLSHGMLVCQHTVKIWAGSDAADLDAVHANTDDANWATIVTTATPMSELAADDFPQVSARFVQLSFDVSNGAGRPCSTWSGFSPPYFGLLRLSEVAISGAAGAPITCRDGVWSELPENFACVPAI